MNLAGHLRLCRLAWRMYFKRADFLTSLSCALRLLRSRIPPVCAPVSTVVGVTYACQCRCDHCGMHMDNVTPQDEMTLDEIQRLTRQARRLGTVEISLFGGEPLMRPDLEKIVVHVRNIGMLCTVDTNGLLLTDKRVATLKAAGICCIKVSLDSAEPGEHDRLRGVSGCFEKAVAGLRACVDTGVPCIISTYATCDNLASGDLKRLIELGRELGVTGVRILDTTLSGCLLSETQRALTNSDRDHLSSLLEPGFVFLENLSSSKALRTPICPCIAKRSIYVSPIGEVQPCCFVPVSFGNVRHEPFNVLVRRVWDDSLMQHDNCQCLMNNEVFRKRAVPAIQSASNLPVSVEELGNTNCDG